MNPISTLAFGTGTCGVGAGGGGSGSGGRTEGRTGGKAEGKGPTWGDRKLANACRLRRGDDDSGVTPDPRNPFSFQL